MTRRLRRLTLRARLVALVLVLLTAVTLVVGAVTVASLHRSLLGQVDDQLASTTQRSRMHLGGAGRDGDVGGSRGGRTHGLGPGAGPGLLGAPGTAVGTLAAVVRGGAVDGAVVGPGGTAQAVPEAAVEPLARLAVSGRPQTVFLPGLGTYRVATTQLAAAGVVVTGLPLAAVEQTVGRLALVVVAVGSAGLAVAAALGWLLVRRTLRPLQEVAAAAAAVARTPLTRGQVTLDVQVPSDDPRTEVGQVSTAVNAMIGHVERSLAVREASERQVRGFVADASHELRTPLAAIRGYAELTRRGHDPVPPGVAQALARVESEAARMTGLVEDLLLLARLDAGAAGERASLDLAPLDLTPVVVDAVTDAHATSPDHRWRLEVPEEPVVVAGDDARLHQVAANLLANVRCHTPAGTSVTASVSRTRDEAVLEVADDGPGIPPDLLPSVFDRFVRGESSRSRAHGSTGLGLAIVHSLVTAHQGTVHVASSPGCTVFTVRLPLHASASRRPTASSSQKVLA